MYKINGWFPVVRCLCGRKHLLKRAQVCVCGATERMWIRRKQPRCIPIVCPPAGYDFNSRPYKRIEVVDWVEATEGRAA